MHRADLRPYRNRKGEGDEMSILDLFGFRPAIPPTRASVRRAEAAQLRQEARWTAADRDYGSPKARHDAITELLRLADEADAEAARLELGL